MTTVDITYGAQAIPRTVFFTDPDGTDVQLNYSRGAKGFFGPPIEINSAPIPLLSGSTARNVRHGARQMPIPVFWKDVSVDEQLPTMRELMFLLDPTRGVSTLRVESPDDITRVIDCRLAEGWDIEELYILFQQGVLVFESEGEPYWRSASAVTQSFMIDESIGMFFPIFPLDFSESAVFASPDITVEGDVGTWPVWTLNGPGDGIVLTNQTTGKVLSLSTPIAAGDSITIDTNPGEKSVVLNNTGESVFGDLSFDSSLWGLERGYNDVTIEMANVTDTSSIALSYYERWLSA